MVEYKIYTKEEELKKSVKVRLLSGFTSEYTGNAIYFGRLEDSSDVVLKFSQLEEGAEREFNGLVLANTHGIPSPRAVALIHREERPSNGFIMQKIEGIPFTEVGNSEQEFQLGLVVRQLHEIKLPYYGPLGDHVMKFDTAKQYLDYWLQRTLPYIGEQSEASKLLADLFTQGKDHILNQEPRLLHRDTQDNNVYVQPNGNIAIIDFEWAQGGNPLDDIGVYLYHAIRTNKPQDKIDAFFRGYFKEHELSNLDKYDLMFHLVLAAGRTVSFCARMNSNGLEEAEANMSKIVLYVKGILRNTPGYPS